MSRVIRGTSVLVMNRRDVFTPVKNTKNQCKDVGHKYYEYNCKIVFDKNTQLDDNDFIIDHSEIDESIQNCLTNYGSCEKMHNELLNSILNKLTMSQTKAIAVKIEIIPKYPEGVANLAIIWCDKKTDLQYLSI